MSDSQNQLLKVADLWERQTRKRDPYLTGAMGGLKILIFQAPRR
jgi:hypothetical protein